MKARQHPCGIYSAPNVFPKVQADWFCCLARQSKGSLIIPGTTERLVHAVLQVPYSHFVHGLQQDNIQLNRKVLSELAMYEPYSFQALVDQVKFMRSTPT